MPVTDTSFPACMEEHKHARRRDCQGTGVINWLLTGWCGFRDVALRPATTTRALRTPGRW
eukprot:6464780-Prymnesium_polylepis.2